MTGRLTCRWCDYSTLSAYTGRDGKVKSGFAQLRAHQEEHHPDQDETISAAAMKFDADLENEIATQAERDAR